MTFLEAFLSVWALILAGGLGVFFGWFEKHYITKRREK